MLTFLLGKEAVFSQQLLTFPWKEAVLPRPSILLLLPQQLLAFLPGKEATLHQQLFTFPQKVIVHPRPLTLPRLTVRHQAVFLLWQLLTFLLGKEAILSQELLTFLWGKETALPRQLFSFPQGKEAIPPRLLLSFHTAKEAAYLRPQVPPRQVKVVIQPGHLGKVIGTPQAQVNPVFPRGQYHLLGRQPHLHPHRPPKVLPMKNPTLSGSSTFPTNP